VLGAIYMLWMYQRVFLGPVTAEENKSLRDLTAREVAVFVPILFLIVLMGVYPKPFLSRMEPAVKSMIAQVKQGSTKSAREWKGSEGMAWGVPEKEGREGQ